MAMISHGSHLSSEFRRHERVSRGVMPYVTLKCFKRGLTDVMQRTQSSAPWPMNLKEKKHHAY